MSWLSALLKSNVGKSLVISAILGSLSSAQKNVVKAKLYAIQKGLLGVCTSKELIAAQNAIDELIAAVED